MQFPAWSRSILDTVPKLSAVMVDWLYFQLHLLSSQNSLSKSHWTSRSKLQIDHHNNLYCFLSSIKYWKIDDKNDSIFKLPMKVQSENAFSTVPYSLTDQLDDSWWKPILSPDEIALPTVIWAVSIESKSKLNYIMQNNGNQPIICMKAKHESIIRWGKLPTLCCFRCSCHYKRFRHSFFRKILQ